MNAYRIADGTSEASLRDRGSRFFAVVAPASDVEQARALVAEVSGRYPDATHVCFAWRIGWPAEERAADAGEPGGTAGQPILAALRAVELTDTVAAVARYFGGTRLGKGGLVRAYGGVVRQALAGLATHRERVRVRLVVACPHELAGAVRRLLRREEIELVGESYGADAELTLAVTPEARESFEAALADLHLAARDIDP